MTAAAALDRVVNSAGVPIAVQDHAGEGPALLLVHGGGRSLADWDRVVEDLRPRHRVVTLDVRGHGHSTPAPSWTFDEVLTDLDAVITELALGHPIVCGHSMGGVIAALHGARNPRCPAIINVDGSGAAIPRTMPGAPGGRERMRELVVRAARDTEKAAGDPEEGDAAWVQARVEEMRRLAQTAGLDAALLEAATRRLHRPLASGRFQAQPTPGSWADAYWKIVEVDTFEVLREVGCPVLYVKAARQDPEDSAGDTEMAGLLAAHNRGCEIELAELAGRAGFRLEHLDSGHMIPLERPAELASLILDFTRSLQPWR